jgi:hypothetical protein
LSGSLPSGLGGLSQLQRVWLGSNRFSGTFPTQLARIATLQEANFNDAGVLPVGCVPAPVVVWES